jgi:xanthine dehydrogenase iron-sulfur cluster and FAD-binding subunit A
VDEVLALLASHGADARILAGGQSLMPLLNMRLARSAVVIDINRVTALEGIRQDNGRLILGALAGDRDIELSAAVRQQCPIPLRRLVTSATSRSATAEPSAAVSPTPIPPRSCLSSPSPSKRNCSRGVLGALARLR